MRLTLIALLFALPVVPVQAENRKYSVGAGYAGSTIDVDTPRGEDDSLTLSGFGLRGRMQLGERWGLQLRYLSDDDVVGGGGKLSLDQAGVQANFTWLETEQKTFHTYVKFGLVWVDFEERIPLTGTFSDQALAPAIGLGLEWGPPRWAFFVDFGVTLVEIELIPGDEESFTVGNTITGFTYRF